MPSLYQSLARRAQAARDWESLFPRLPTDEGEPGLWKAIETRIATSGVIPRPHPGVEAHAISERGVSSWVLKRRETNTYLRLSEEDYFIWRQMDGAQTVLQITVAYMKEYKKLALSRVSALMDTLRTADLLEGGKPALVYESLSAKFASRGYRAWLGWLMESFIFRQVAFSGFSGAVDGAYRLGVRLLYARPLLILYLIVSLAGLGVYLFGPKTSITMPATPASAVSLGIAILVIMFLHECGHAFTVKYFGREVNRGGLFLMFGIPGAFIDTTDMWLAPKRARLAVTAAGPIVHLIIAGAATLWGLAVPGLAADMRRFAFINYLIVLVNLTPFIKLDGYYLLMDAMEIPNLRERAVAFVSRDIWLKLRQSWAAGEWWPRFSREEAFYIFFGGISTLYTFYFLYFGTLFLPARFVNLVTQFQQINFRSLASVGVLVSAAFTITFGAAQVMFTAERLQNQLQRLVRAVRQMPAWQSTLLVAAVAFAIAYIPAFLAGRSLSASALWAGILPPLTTGLTAGLALHLARGMRASPWRLAYTGLALAAAGLAVGALWDDAHLPLLWAGVAALGLLPALRLWLSSLRGSIGAAWLLIGAAFPILLLPDPAIALYGAALLLGGTFVAWQLIHRPLPAPVRPLEMTGSSLDPLREGVYLGTAFAWLMEHSLAQTVAVLGRASQPSLIDAFNRAAAENGRNMWFEARGILVDHTPGSPLDRKSDYLPTLTGWLAQLGGALEAEFAADTLAAAWFELPPRLRRLTAIYLLDNLPWEGAAPWRAEEGGDRLKLKLGFRHLAEWCLQACQRVYGAPLAERLLAEFNTVAALAEWGIWFRANGRLSEKAAGDLPTLTEIFQSALADLLGRMAYYTGVTFVERSVLQAHDTLPWQLREVAAPALLHPLRWGARLASSNTNDPVLALRRAPALSGLPAETAAHLAQRAHLEQHTPGRIIQRAGRRIRHARLIRSGRVELAPAGSTPREAGASLEAGTLLYAEEIRHNRRAPADARALTTVETLRLPARAVARALLEAPPRPEVTLLSRIPLFSQLAPLELQSLANTLQPASLVAGEVAVWYGEPGRELYLINTGEFVVSVPEPGGGERQIAHIGSGEFFGEMALLRQEPRVATVRAVTDAQVWILAAADYAAFLESSTSLQHVLEQVSSRRRMELQTP